MAVDRLTVRAHVAISEGAHLLEVGDAGLDRMMRFVFESDPPITSVRLSIFSALAAQAVWRAVF
jgi:hypothetical protein